MGQWGYDETNGVVIGGFYTNYKFLQRHAIFEFREVVATTFFESGTDDAVVLGWFAENYPENWARRAEQPIEMRVFDGSGREEEIVLDIRKARGR